MEKTEMMKRYEAETGSEAIDYLTEYPFDEYTRWLEAKAAAYDRLMSGGKKTLKEWANLLHRPVAIDFGGVAESFSSIPMRCDSAGYWYCDENAEDFEDEHFIIPKDVVHYNGSWQASLTLPDGWEEK